MIDTLASFMFAKITLNKNAILVAYTLMSDVACASTTLKHSCAADFYVMLCGMRAFADCYKNIFIIISEWSILISNEFVNVNVKWLYINKVKLEKSRMQRRVLATVNYAYARFDRDWGISWNIYYILGVWGSTH